MPEESKTFQRWRTLRTARITLLIFAACFVGVDTIGGGRSGAGQIGVISLLVAIPVAIWERRTRKKAGAEAALVNGEQKLGSRQ